MAWFLTLVAASGTPVNIEIPSSHAPDQVEEQLACTPDGQWAVIYGVVDGAIVRMRIRPERYGAFFTHFVAEKVNKPV